MLRQYLHSEFVLILTVTWKKASCLMPHKEDLKFKLQPHKDTPLKENRPTKLFSNTSE